jgi:hypothetical protein
MKALVLLTVAILSSISALAADPSCTLIVVKDSDYSHIQKLELEALPENQVGIKGSFGFVDFHDPNSPMATATPIGKNEMRLSFIYHDGAINRSIQSAVPVYPSGQAGALIISDRNAHHEETMFMSLSCKGMLYDAN